MSLGALAGAALVWRYVPPGLNIKPVDARMWREIFGNKVLLAVVAVTLLQSVPQFVVISYIVPAISAFLGASPAMIGLIMAGFGLTGVLGNVLAARFVDRVGAQNLVMAAMLSMLASHLVWPWSVGALPVLLLSLFLWGIASFTANSAQQARLSALAPQSTSVSIAMNSSALYLGQAIGTGIGGLMLAAVPGVAGYTSLVWVSVPLFALAIGVSLFANKKSPVARAFF
jgi:predicted MFS family arabinose efflux permease